MIPYLLRTNILPYHISDAAHWHSRHYGIDASPCATIRLSTKPEMEGIMIKERKKESQKANHNDSANMVGDADSRMMQWSSSQPLRLSGSGV